MRSSKAKALTAEQYDTFIRAAKVAIILIFLGALWASSSGYDTTMKVLLFINCAIVLGINIPKRPSE